ncbi:MAG TPA: Fic family protein [Desulfuromonadales bacterium]|nr:Fic family protein [Desulfuromonadales bacterium]
MTFDRSKPHNDLPLLPPPVDLETKAVLKQAIAANRALADLKGLARQIPNQGVLINGIVLQEARLSSEIENIVTTNDELYRAAADMEGSTDPHTKEVLRYRQALWTGFQGLQERPLSTNLFIDIVRNIKQADMDIRKVTGTALKSQQGDVVYTPPEGESIIRDKLANLESFIHAEDGLDQLVRLAVIHYQFEAIHPFPDGNGRTGRIINILFLVEKGLLDIPVLFLSHYILRNKADYYAGLRGVTEEGSWEPWVLFMLRAIEETARKTSSRVERILAMMDEVKVTVQENASRIYSKDLIETIFMHPYCKIRFLEEAGIAKRQTASDYLKTLATIGVLRPEKVGREVYYINDRLYKILVEE